jgi:CxxC motif-containing protein
MKPNIVSTSTVHHSKEVPKYDMPPLLDHTKEMKPMGQVSTIEGILQSCVKLINDPSSIKVLKNTLERCSIETEGNIEQKISNHLHTRRRTSRDFKMNANIRDFNMGDIILNLGSEVNVLPKKTWKCMGDPTLGYSPIQLKLENQHRVLQIGRLKGVTLDLDGV